jgi:hypothetical protein
VYQNITHYGSKPTENGNELSIRQNQARNGRKRRLKQTKQSPRTQRFLWIWKNAPPQRYTVIS